MMVRGQEIRSGPSGPEAAEPGRPASRIVPKEIIFPAHSGGLRRNFRIVGIAHLERWRHSHCNHDIFLFPPASSTSCHARLPMTKRSPEMHPRTAPATGVRGNDCDKQEGESGRASGPTQMTDRKKEEAYLPRSIPVKGDWKSSQPGTQ